MRKFVEVEVIDDDSAPEFCVTIVVPKERGGNGFIFDGEKTTIWVDEHDVKSRSQLGDHWCPQCGNTSRSSHDCGY